MTDIEAMKYRFSTKNIKKGTGIIAKELGIPRKDFEAAVQRGLKQEAATRR